MTLLLHDVRELMREESPRAVACQRCSARHMHRASSREGIGLDGSCVRIDLGTALDVDRLRCRSRDRRDGSANIGRHLL